MHHLYAIKMRRKFRDINTLRGGSVRSPCGWIRTRFTRFNHWSRALPQPASRGGKTRTSVYCASDSSPAASSVGENGALITFVFQGVQTCDWDTSDSLWVCVRSRVRTTGRLVSIETLSLSLPFIFHRSFALSLTLPRFVITSKC